MADGRRCTLRRGTADLPAFQLRLDDARPLFLVVLAVLMVALIVGDPGRIDREATWLRVLTGVLIGVITLVNAGSWVRLVYAIIHDRALHQ